MILGKFVTILYKSLLNLIKFTKFVKKSRIYILLDLKIYFPKKLFTQIFLLYFTEQNNYSLVLDDKFQYSLVNLDVILVYFHSPISY